jgi:putative membrane protein
MHRRAILIGSAAALALPQLALAQSRGPSPGADDQGPAETKHMQDTMKAGSASLEMSRIAVQKARSPHVKQFAQFEVAEQETIAEILKTMQGANVTTGQGAAPNAEAQANLDAKSKSTQQKLQSAKAGPEFDREYVMAQIDGHNDLLKIQETYISSGKVREEVNVAKLARGMIKEHLTLLNEIKTDLKRT